MRNQIELPTLDQVKPGGTVTLHCPRGLTYDSITFELENVTPADMQNFKVITNSKAQWDVSSAERIRRLNAHYKRQEAANELTLWFYKPEMKTEAERAYTSLGTADLNSLVIQFKLPNTVTNPSIKAYATQRYQQQLGEITKLREYVRTFSTAGQQQIDNINPAGEKISAFHLIKADIDHCILEVNNGFGAGNLVDWPKNRIHNHGRQYGRDPQDDYCTTLDMNLLGKQHTYMTTDALQHMAIKPNLLTDGQVTVLVEYVGGYGGV